MSIVHRLIISFACAALFIACMMTGCSSSKKEACGKADCTCNPCTCGKLCAPCATPCECTKEIER